MTYNHITMVQNSIGKLLNEIKSRYHNMYNLNLQKNNGKKNVVRVLKTIKI